MPPPTPHQPAPIQPSGRSSACSRQALLLGALLLTTLVVAAFFNGIKAPYVFDDHDSIADNTSIRSFKTALTPPIQNGITVSGRPILNLSFAINYAFDKTSPGGIRAVNILIHALAALTLWGVVRRTLSLAIFRGRFSAQACSLAWFVAAMWAVHPLQTEAVTYAVQRAESLASLFYLLTLYCYIRYTEARHWKWFTLSVAACLLGMGTKEVMATAPIVLFLYDRSLVSGSFRAAWQRHGRLLVGLAATLVLLAVLVFAAKARGGSVGTDSTVTYWGYLRTQAYAVVHYLQLSLWPVGLVFDYGICIVSDPATLIRCGLLVLALLGATGWALAREPRYGFLGAWFFVILAPSSSFIPVNTQTMAEHRVYLALVAVMAGLALTAFKFLGRKSWIVLIPLILLEASATAARNNIYRSEAAIWENVTANCPDNPRGWHNLASYLLYKGKNPAEAKPYAERALALRPNSPESMSVLGQILIKLGRRNEGIALIEKSLALSPTNVLIQASAGSAFMDCEQYERALPLLQAALGHTPSSPSLHYDLGNVLMNLNRAAEAEHEYQLALAENPGDVDALSNYGTLLRQLGRFDEAIDHYEHALEAAPHSAKLHNNLGVACMAAGKTDQGLFHLREAVRLEPANTESRLNLCRALAEIGRTDEAIFLCESLLKEKPGSGLYNNLGTLYGNAGQLEKALGAFRSAVELDPSNASARANYDKLRAYLDAQGAQ